MGDWFLFGTTHTDTHRLRKPVWFCLRNEPSAFESENLRRLREKKKHVKPPELARAQQVSVSYTFNSEIFPFGHLFRAPKGITRAPRNTIKITELKSANRIKTR